MAKLTKKQKAQEGKVDSTKLYPLADALALQKTRHVLIILRPDVPVQNVATVLELLSAQGIGSVQIAEAPSARRAAP